MEHVKQLEFPKGTPEQFVQDVAMKITSWYIVTKHSVEGLVIGWDQTTYYGQSAEGLAAFVEGLMMGFNQVAKKPIRCTTQHPGCSPITC
jgi:hypothetical protein